MSVSSLKLSSGHNMPMFGLGTWKSPPGKVRAAVEHAIDVGYHHIDCARAYQNENEVGEAIETKIKEGKVKRGDLFITSKLWNVFHNPEDVRPAFMESLNALKLDYLDLYLIHWPMGYVNNGELFPKDKDGKFIIVDTDYVDTWKALEKLQEEGLIRSIGVSNFNEFQIDRILKEGKIAPVTNQVELHPYLIQENLVKFCQSKGVTLTAYSPLGSADRPWAKPDEPTLLEDPKLKEIATRVNKTVAQIVLRYQIQRGIIVIPKSVTPSRIESNIQIFDFNLSDEDMKTIANMNRNFRGCGLEWVSYHKYYPFLENYSE